MTTIDGAKARGAETVTKLDGVRLAVITHRLEAVARKMTNTLFRTARSGVINNAKDFSCCILTATDELLVSAESLPIHVFVGPDLCAGYMRRWFPNLKRGDAFFHNSPYHGNSHAADHTMLVPVVDDDGIHRFTVFVKAHVADCGNAVPTTLVMDARDVYEEGALIYPCIQVQEDYQHREDVLRTFMVRIRVPEMWWGDYLGMLGAVRIGEQELMKIGAELGWDTLQEYTREWFAYSESRMSAAIRRLPSGHASVTNLHDPLPAVPDGVEVAATVEVDSEKGFVEVDLRGSADAVPCGINLTEATARTAAMIGVFNSIDHTVPKNAGSFRRVRVLLRENCVTGIPVHPTSTSVATTGVADRAASAVQRAMAQISDGAGMAETGSFGPIACSVISGRDPRRGEAPFVNMLFIGITGGAGTPHSDGWLTMCHVGNGGMMLRDSVEIDEYLYPVRILASYIVPDREGAGRFRGTASNYVELTPVGCSIEVVWAADTTVFPPAGVRGGLSGSPHRAYLRSSSGELAELAGFGRFTLDEGDTIVSLSATGGGYGSPLEREPARVAQDVQEGWLTAERAREVYGVSIRADGSVDLKLTGELRADGNGSV